MKILIIENDKLFGKEIVLFCNQNQNETIIIDNELEAIELINSHKFDMYIINIDLPNIDGLDIIKYIRSTDIDTPILVITESNKLQDLQKAYEYGCNEYMKKPFHLEELEIRVKQIVRKKSDKYIKFNNDFYYNLDENNFYYKTKPIELRYKEKRFCYLLTKNYGKIVASDSIYSYVWENDTRDIYPLRQLVAELRKKLPFNIIKTKAKEGYFIKNTQQD